VRSSELEVEKSEKEYVQKIDVSQQKEGRKKQGEATSRRTKSSEAEKLMKTGESERESKSLGAERGI
jgi:hypothetical protein